MTQETGGRPARLWRFRRRFARRPRRCPVAALIGGLKAGTWRPTPQRCTSSTAATPLLQPTILRKTVRELA